MNNNVNNNVNNLIPNLFTDLFTTKTPLIPNLFTTGKNRENSGKMPPQNRENALATPGKSPPLAIAYNAPVRASDGTRGQIAPRCRLRRSAYRCPALRSCNGGRKPRTPYPAAAAAASARCH